MMKRKLLSALLCCLLAATATAASAVGDPAEDEAWKNEPYYGKEIRIGYNGGLCLGTFGIAYHKGFYEAEGLKVKIIRNPNATQADILGTGKAEVAGDHITTLLVPAVNGVRMKFTTGIHSGCKSLYVLGDSKIKSTAGLVGGTIAIHDGIGASDHNIALRFLKRDGIDADKIKWRVVEAGAAILAMENGEITAGLFSDQFAKPFLDAGKLRPIRSITFDDDFKNEACCIHAVNLDFYNENPITVKKLTRAHEAASRWMMEHPEEAVQILQDNNYASNAWASGDDNVVLELFKTYNFNITDEQTEETLRSVIEDYKSFGHIDKNKDTEELIQQIWDPVLAE